MINTDRVAEDARTIDAHLRVELAAKRITKFSLLVSSMLEVSPSSIHSATKTYAEVVRADGKHLTIGVPSSSCQQVTQCLGRSDPRVAQVGAYDSTAEAKGFRVTRFLSDDATPLARDDETWMQITCALRYRDSPPPRMYGEDPEPEHFKVRSATLETPSWPDDKAFAEVVARAAAQPTF